MPAGEAYQGWTRRDLLRRSVQAGVGLMVGGTLLESLVGCGPASTTTTTSSTAPVTLTYPSWMFSEPDTGRYYKQLAAAFHKQHPNITVDLINLSAGSYVEKIFTEISGGEVPDILPLFTTQMPQYMHLGLLEPLDHWLDTAPFKNQLLPLQRFAQKDGKNYGVVLTASPQGLVYNAQLLDRAGVGVPTTLDELYAAGEAIWKKTGVYGFGVHVDPTAMLLAYVSCMQWVLGFGSNFSQPDGTITCNAPKTIEAFDAMMRFVKAPFVPKGLGYYQLRTMLAQGKVAMLIDGPWDLGQVKTENPALYPHIGMAASPTPTHAAITGGAFYTMLRKDTHKDDVWEFIALATSEPWQQRWMDVEVQVPGINLTPSAAFLAANPGYKAVPEIAAKYAAGFGYFPPGYELVATAFQTRVINHVAPMWAGAQTPRQAMDAAQADLEQWAKSLSPSERTI